MNDDKKHRRQTLLAYLKRIHTKVHDEYDEETDPNYQYHDWIDELEQCRMDYHGAVHQIARQQGFNANEYIQTHKKTGRLAKLEDRILSIQEWFDDHHLESTLESAINNQDYIWWYCNSVNGMSSEESEQFNTNEVKKRKQIGDELAIVNDRKKQLEAKLRPWQSKV